MLVQEYFKSRKDIVESAIEYYLSKMDKDSPPILRDAIRYSVQSRGKRLRPILFFSAYEMILGRKNKNRLQKISPVAVALEFVHTASLIHDDLPSMDDSTERRGIPSCHIKFDVPTALLAGDALITLAYEVITDLSDNDKAIECIKILSDALSTRGMIGGQVVDVLSAQKKVNENVLHYIHIKKTGALLQAAIEMACTLHSANENLTITLSNFARNLGLAYQIVDDILDEVGSYDILGKEPGSDSRNERSTYPLVIGLEKSKKKAEKLLRDSHNLIKNMKNNQILLEFVSMIKDRLP